MTEVGSRLLLLQLKCTTTLILSVVIESDHTACSSINSIMNTEQVFLFIHTHYFGHQYGEDADCWYFGGWVDTSPDRKAKLEWIQLISVMLPHLLLQCWDPICHSGSKKILKYKQSEIRTRKMSFFSLHNLFLIKPHFPLSQCHITVICAFICLPEKRGYSSHSAWQTMWQVLWRGRRGLRNSFFFFFWCQHTRFQCFTASSCPRALSSRASGALLSAPPPVVRVEHCSSSGLAKNKPEFVFPPSGQLPWSSSRELWEDDELGCTSVHAAEEECFFFFSGGVVESWLRHKNVFAVTFGCSICPVGKSDVFSHSSELFPLSKSTDVGSFTAKTEISQKFLEFDTFSLIKQKQSQPNGVKKMVLIRIITSQKKNPVRLP